VADDYERIASAIDYIRCHVRQQPSLEDIADQLNLSASHFQRLFSRWAGVSPKRFLQVLTLQSAQDLLLKTDMSVLDVSSELGLTSGSRLYDHFVQLQAMTPAEYRQQGHGLSISYGIHQTPFGHAFIAVTARGICKLVFVDEQSKQQLVSDLKQQWDLATVQQDLIVTKSVIEKLFTVNSNPKSPLTVLVKGTNFQLAVWQALLAIPEGKLASYSQVANAIAKPKAVRAVASAIAANPVGYLIPCHRVIRQNGYLGGYRWGLIRKHAMIINELSRHDNK